MATSVPTWSATSNGEAEDVGVPAEEGARQDQVRRAGHRQELGEPLDHAEQRGGEQRDRTRRASLRRRRRVGFRACAGAVSTRRPSTARLRRLRRAPAR